MGCPGHHVGHLVHCGHDQYRQEDGGWGGQGNQVARGVLRTMSFVIWTLAWRSEVHALGLCAALLLFKTTVFICVMYLPSSRCRGRMTQAK